MKRFLSGTLLMALVLGLSSIAISVEAASNAATSIRARTLGHILLQVENHGEAWYVDPLTARRFYMKDGATAYEMMRTFGLGMTEADYARLAAGDRQLLTSLRGRIVLRVQAHGEAYYIHPTTSAVHYLADGPAAYSLMRQHSLGVTNADLSTITAAELELRPGAAVLGTDDDDVDTAEIGPSQYQEGKLPSAFTVAKLNEYWLEIVNEERVGRGLSTLSVDQGLVDVATAWSTYLGEVETLTHTRTDGIGLLSWASSLDYEARSMGENLTAVYVVDSAAGLRGGIIESMELFMAEESYNGAHFQNVTDVDWERTAVGAFFETYGANKYRVYLTFHFADLE